MRGIGLDDATSASPASRARWTLSAGLALTILLCAPARAQRAGDFRVLGPGGGGAMFLPAISPFDPNTVLVACDMTGSYITHDGGRTWRMFNLRGGSTAAGFAFDPTHRGVIYDVGIGLWKSSDEGATWKMVWPRPRDLRGTTDASDHADIDLLIAAPDGGTEPFGKVTAIALDPDDGQKLWAVRREETLSFLWRSVDAGDSWKQVTALPSPARHITVTAHGLWLDGPGGAAFWNGKSLAPLNTGPEPFQQTSIDASSPSTNDAVLLLGIRQDTLQVWAADPSGVRGTVIASLAGRGAHITVAAGGHDGKTIFASFRDLTLDGRSFQGIAKSVDAGHTWSLPWKDDGHGDPHFSDGWISGALGSAWGGEPLAITVSLKDPSLVYATDLGRTMKSTDGGAHWEALYSRPAPGGGAVSTGLDVLTSYGVFFDPFNVRRIFVAYTDVGLFRSEDAGASWVSSSRGMPPAWRNTTYWVVLDPDVRNVMWAATSGTHDLPRPKMWRHNATSTFQGGVCFSTDGGRTWISETNGLPVGSVTHLVLDPRSPPGKRTLYAAVFGHGVYKSVDNGKSWALKASGISQRDPLAFRLALSPNGDLYTVIARRSEDGSIGNSNDGALYRSRDQAEHWERISLPEGVNGPNGLTVDPRDPARLYLAAWPRETGLHGAGGGIFGSTDGGVHWKLLFDRNQHIYDVTYDPRSTDVLYATGFESSAWISPDRGQHWRRIAGYNFMWGHRVIADPTQPGSVYIDTFGGGIWHGRTDEQETGVEDIATPQLAPRQ
jgi:photosystem II stability/assembly factor-like uncharacterized protein